MLYLCLIALLQENRKVINEIILEDVKKIKGDLKRDDFEEKCVLITGGAGFIGSWLCDVLTDFGAEVYCVDNLSTGELRNIDHLLMKPNFKFFNDDACTFKSDRKYDFILHLASRASPEEYQLHPIETLQANSVGSYNMLELARKNDARILYTSTSEIYGDSEIIPTPETYWGNVNPVGVRSCYDEGKRFGEALSVAFNRQFGIDVRIVRIFNSYGPRIRADGNYARAVPRFIVQALTGQPITIYGDGSQTRSFCYIVDTALAILQFLAKDGAKGEIINVGNSQEITILEFAKKVKELTKSLSSLTFHPLPKDDPRRRCPDTDKAKKLLGWEPRITLDQGLLRTIAWFRQRLM
jgi:UDP-glucuronate decarboxylase